MTIPFTSTSEPDLTIQLPGLTLSNPLIAASGCFGFGEEASEWLDLSLLGGIASKGLTLEPRIGNRTPRTAETASGMLNSVGLQNPGIDGFIRDHLPFMLRSGSAVIVNIAGQTTEDYLAIAEKLNDFPLAAIEINLSCPNVSAGCISIGTDPEQIYQLVRRVRQISRHQLWAKLTPNVTSIAICAEAAEKAGADAVSLINTLLGMAVDLKTRRPILKNNTGGLSGPCVKPVALRMVSEVYRSISIPVIGLGGIASGEDVLEFICAGASAVQIGTQNLIDPYAMIRIRSELIEAMRALSINDLNQFKGSLQLW